VVFDPFGVGPRRLGANAERNQKFLDQAMTLARRLRQLPPLVGEKNRTIGLACYQTVAAEPLDGIIDGCVRNPEAAGEINDARLAPLLDEIGDQFDIVFCELALMRVTHMPESFGLPVRLVFLIIATYHLLLL
jgi:hypothetical protein